MFCPHCDNDVQRVRCSACQHIFDAREVERMARLTYLQDAVEVWSVRGLLDRAAADTMLTETHAELAALRARLRPTTPRPAASSPAAMPSPPGNGGGTATERGALRDLAAATGIRPATLTEGVALLVSLGDHVGIARWNGARPGAGPAMALITQLKISDVVALTGDASVRRRVQALRQGVSWRVAYVHDGVKVYRFSIGSTGVAYGCLVAGDGVFASDPATANRIIEANGGA